jgi:hypothetical protein
MLVSSPSKKAGRINKNNLNKTVNKHMVSLRSSVIKREATKTNATITTEIGLTRKDEAATMIDEKTIIEVAANMKAAADMIIKDVTTECRTTFLKEVEEMVEIANIGLEDKKDHHRTQSTPTQTTACITVMTPSFS